MVHYFLILSLLISGLALAYIWISIAKAKKKIFNKSKGVRDNKHNKNSTNISQNNIITDNSIILFEAGMSNLKPESVLRLEEIMDWMKKESGRESEITINIIGSADSSGNLSRNQILAKERSIVVKNYIRSKLKSIDPMNAKKISIMIQPILVRRGNTPRERELLRSVKVSVENFF